MFEQLTSKNGKKLINKTTKLPVYKESVEHRILTLCKMLYGQNYKAFLPRVMFN
jgi:predicted ArsR family transcriptional regulator